MIGIHLVPKEQRSDFYRHVDQIKQRTFQYKNPDRVHIIPEFQDGKIFKYRVLEVIGFMASCQGPRYRGKRENEIYVSELEAEFDKIELGKNTNTKLEETVDELTV